MESLYFFDNDARNTSANWSHYPVTGQNGWSEDSLLGKDSSWTSNTIQVRTLKTHFLDSFRNDNKDNLQSFSNYNQGVADDTDQVESLVLKGWTTLDGLGEPTENSPNMRFVYEGEVLDFSNGQTYEIPWADVEAGKVKIENIVGAGHHAFNLDFAIRDSGDKENAHGDMGETDARSDRPGRIDIRNSASPVALDLNGDGKIGTTGASTAKHRVIDEPLGHTVQFDIDADGTLDTIEWMNGDGDGLLVDTSKINGNFIDGNALFGDQGGKFDNGYEKMALEDDNKDGKLSGAELDNLAVWVDDGDAILEEGELRKLGEFGITELSTQKNDVLNQRGETLMQSTATTDKGDSILTEDVWFAQK